MSQIAQAAKIAENLEQDHRDQQRQAQQVVDAYSHDPRSVITARDELEQLDREAADELAAIVAQYHERRQQIRHKLQQECSTVTRLIKETGSHVSPPRETNYDPLDLQDPADAHEFGQRVWKREGQTALRRLADERSE